MPGVDDDVVEIVVILISTGEHNGIRTAFFTPRDTSLEWSVDASLGKLAP